MSKKEVIFGVKRGGTTYLYEFDTRAIFNRAKAAAKRLGVSMGDLIGSKYSNAKNRELQQPRKFTDEDKKSSRLKLAIAECDEFTRTALERQASYNQVSVEELMLDVVFSLLESVEEDSILDPKTAEVVIQGHELGDYIGCKVDEDATELPPSNFSRIPIPPGTIIETYA